jgi:hypothetical protein
MKACCENHWRSSSPRKVLRVSLIHTPLKSETKLKIVDMIISAVKRYWNPCRVSA